MAVYERDGGRCVAPALDPDMDPCSGRLTFQHVRDEPGAPRITEIDRVLCLCEHHHLDGWATSKRGLGVQRGYLGLLD